MFLSSGSPMIKVFILSFNLSITDFATDSWTNNLDPAQHTCPWLKKMALIIPSTAWSMAASANMIFAPLPPNSRVSFLSVAFMESLTEKAKTNGDKR